MLTRSDLVSSPEWLRLREIIEANSLRTEREYILSSGEKSGYYFDMKPTTFSAEGLNLTCQIMYELLPRRHGVYVGGLAVGAVPVVSALTLYSASRNPIMGFCVRSEIKNHGTQQLIEGNLEDGAKVVIIDDVTTKETSAMKAIDVVRKRHCAILRVIIIVDRLEGAAETFRKEGLECGLRHDKDFGYTILRAIGLLVFIRVMTFHTASPHTGPSADRMSKTSTEGML
jgi:orotate phosphoribosyltransferase